jgi:1-pyrroline-5-carboxylate dehydrogenase
MVYKTASSKEVELAITTAVSTQEKWSSMPFEDRAAIFLKAADLIAGKYRYKLMAATMLGQGKTAWQAEIDAAAELVDFLRFSVQYAQEMYAQQPEHHAPGVWNRLEYRPLPGFVYAVSPFNFTAIAANLVCAPALMGNTVVWKPSDSAMLSNAIFMEVLLEAGLPAGVINFVPGDPTLVTDAVLASKHFAALHFTGSTDVFRSLYGKIAQGVANGLYDSYPRIVGETGGKNFHFIHESADIENAAVQTVRGAFEYSGQKCSATSRCYVAKSIWPEFKERLVAETQKLKVGDPTKPETFIGPVIHERSFKKLSTVIELAKKDASLKLLAGGKYDSSEGYYIHPTVYETTNPSHPLLSAELFGPILVVYVYDDKVMKANLGQNKQHPYRSLVEDVTSYALTGSVFAQDRTAIQHLTELFSNAAGNFYVNCKSTGAVVGQQPFGGGKASGTNDKAGSANLLSRFVSVRSIKEEFVPTTKVEYPSNEV